MNLLSYTLLSLRGRRTNVTFTIIAIMLSVMLTLTVLIISKSIEKGIKDQAGFYDLVVGAEGSPMQLVLNSLIYLETPVGNIPYELYEQLSVDERVLRAVPIALGDSYFGYPIVGTVSEFFQPFRDGMKERFELEEGKWLGGDGDILLGAETAKQTGMSVGDTFYGNHGAGDAGEKHGEFMYKVSGVLKHTGTADDRAIFTTIGSVWAVHGHQERDDAAERNKGKEITALLIKPEQLGYAPALKEELDGIHEVQATYPVKIFRQLLETFNAGKSIAYMFSLVSIGMAILFLMYAVLSSLAQKKQENEILNALGVPRQKMIISNLMEIMLISFTGTVLGMIFSIALFYIISAYSTQNFGLNLPGNLLDFSILKYAISLFMVSIVISIIPSIKLYGGKTAGK